jgi:hypothetical protein
MQRSRRRSVSVRFQGSEDEKEKCRTRIIGCELCNSESHRGHPLLSFRLLEEWRRVD